MSPRDEFSALFRKTLFQLTKSSVPLQACYSVPSAYLGKQLLIRGHRSSAALQKKPSLFPLLVTSEICYTQRLSHPEITDTKVGLHAQLHWKTKFIKTDFWYKFSIFVSSNRHWETDSSVSSCKQMCRWALRDASMLSLCLQRKAMHHFCPPTLSLFQKKTENYRVCLETSM